MSPPTAYTLQGRDKPRIQHGALWLGDREVPLYSGALHYWRVPRKSWSPALREMRRLGLHLVETYVPWDVHETEPGEFDFGERDQNKDLAHFLTLAKQEDLLVFLRPGPHINAELTRFGVPERIINDPRCQARSPRGNRVMLPFPPRMFPVPSYVSHTFHEETHKWYTAVAKIIAPYMHPQGPVVLLQIDNEAAFYFRNGPYDQDYHPDAIALWRSFLERKHASPDKLGHKSWDEIPPPERFSAQRSEELIPHLEWAEFQEFILSHAIERMRKSFVELGLGNVPTIHNLPLGEGGLPCDLCALEEIVDVVGLDYYHPARHFEAIKRRTLYLSGTVDFPYAPELGVGAPPWFPPLRHEDSLFTAMVAAAYGLRGFNLYMAVDRDRWCGALLDNHGNPRTEAGTWKQWISHLRGVHFHKLRRRVSFALIVPAEYARLSRATHLMGPISSSTLEAFGGTPVDACREDSFGFAQPIQIDWWENLALWSQALTKANVPYVYLDSRASFSKWKRYPVLIAPTFEFVSERRWKTFAHASREGARTYFGPHMPSLDESMKPHLFEVPHNAQFISIQSVDDALGWVENTANEIGLERPFRISPPPLELTVHEDDNGRPRVLFAIHPGSTPIEATVEVPAPVTLHDALSAERITGPTELRFQMKPQSCRMLIIEHIGDAAAKPVRAPRARVRRSHS